jgi:predicted DNA-binding transcriptional regulator AlpA
MKSVQPTQSAPHPASGRLLPNVEKEITVEPFINKREVALRLGNTTRTVDNMMRRGMIPYYKLGYRVAFRWSEIQSHLAQTCRICRA